MILDVPTALHWIKSTFYYIRMKKRPRFYDAPGSSEKDIDNYLRKMIIDSLNSMTEYNIIRMEDGIDVYPEIACHVMAEHIVPFSSMKTFIDMKFDDFSMQELLHVLSSCEKLQVSLRRSEKKILNELHKSFPYNVKTDLPPSKFRVQLPSHKTFVLLQAAMSGYDFENYTLKQETARIVECATMMLNAIESYSVESSRHGKIALTCLQLKRCIDTGLLKSGDGMLIQLPGLGKKTTTKLKLAGVVSFTDVLMTELSVLEKAAGRKAPFGDELKFAATRILLESLTVTATLDEENKEVKCEITSFDVESHVIPENNTTTESYFDKVKRTMNATTAASKKKLKKASYILVVYSDHPGGLLMWRKDIHEPGIHKVKCPEKWGKITIRLVSIFMGLDVQSEISGGSCPYISKIETQNAKSRGIMAQIFASPNKRLKIGSASEVTDARETCEAAVEKSTEGISSENSQESAPSSSPVNNCSNTTADERAKAFGAGVASAAAKGFRRVRDVNLPLSMLQPQPVTDATNMMSVMQNSENRQHSSNVSSRVTTVQNPYSKRKVQNPYLSGAKLPEERPQLTHNNNYSNGAARAYQALERSPDFHSPEYSGSRQEMFNTPSLVKNYTSHSNPGAKKRKKEREKRIFVHNGGGGEFSSSYSSTPNTNTSASSGTLYSPNFKTKQPPRSSLRFAEFAYDPNKIENYLDEGGRSMGVDKASFGPARRINENVNVRGLSSKPTPFSAESIQRNKRRRSVAGNVAGGRAGERSILAQKASEMCGGYSTQGSVEMTESVPQPFGFGDAAMTMAGPSAAVAVAVASQGRQMTGGEVDDAFW